MNEWLNLPDGGWWYVAGWTMLHFLWLGALVGLVAGVCRLVLRRASANLRYATALVCLMLLAAMPLGIAAMLVEQYHATSHVFQKVGVDTATGVPILHRVEATPPWLQPSAPGSAGGSTDAASAEPPAPIATVTSREPATITITNPNLRPTQKLGTPQGLVGVFAIVAAYLPWAWFVGSPLTLILLTVGVIGGERLRRSSRLLDDGPIAEACAEFIAALGIGRRVTVAICERIASPVLVGIVRPMILLPPAALTGWSPDEIEMVLLHELAHVRRWDNLVNLVQRFVEAALFFHPVVWLVSRWVRAEREACCDAVVVGRTNQPHAYAEMLVALAAQMPRSVLFHPAASSAMAAGPLRGRIRRILGLQDDPMLVSGKSLSLVMGGLLVLAMLLMLYLPQETTAEEAKSAADNSVAAVQDADDQARQVESMNHLKYLALALHNYHDAKGSLPAAASYDRAGQPLLSWRVHILPYLDDGSTGKDSPRELYKEFHLDEPWDSAHNKNLIARMPEIFKNPNSPDTGQTNYLAATGPECVFDGTPRGIRFQEVRDGTAHTIMLVEADIGVEWTRPEDYDFASDAPDAGLGSIRPKGFIAAYVDGSIHLVDKATSLEKTRDLFTRGRSTIDREQNVAATGAEMEMVPELELMAEGGIPSRSLSDAIEDFNARAQADDRGRTEPALSEDEVLKAIAQFDWNGARVEASIREIFATIAETRLLPHDAHLDFTSRYSNGQEEFDVWWIGLSVMTAPNTGYTLPIRGEQAEFKMPASKLSASKFPSPEEQKWADVAWRRLAIEFTPLIPKFAKKQDKPLLEYVREAGYDGGVMVTVLGKPRMEQKELQQFDILVGLDASPVTSMKDLATILSRSDLAESNPIKFYALRVAKNPEEDGKLEFASITGRIFVNLDPPQLAPTPTPVTYSPPAPPHGITYPAMPHPAQPVPVPTAPNANAPQDGEVRVPVTLIDEHQPPIVVGPTYSPPAPQPMLATSPLAAPASDPLTDSEKQQLRAAGGVRIDFFYHRDSKPCLEAAKLVPKYEKAFAGVVKVERIDVGKNPAAAKEAGVDRVPTFKFYLGERPITARTGEMTVDELDSTLKSIAFHEAYEPPVSMVKPQPELRYAGKTFDEWRTIWQTELSLERRLEVVKALAAFGASGRGREAAQAILDVANQLDWTSVDFNSPSGKLKQGCIDAFTTGNSTEGYRIPVNDWWPLVVPIYENSPDKSTIVSYLSYQLPAGEKELIPKLLALSQKGEGTRKLALYGLRAIDPQLKDDRVVLRLRDMLKNSHDSPDNLRTAISNLLYSTGGNMGGGGGGGYGTAPGLVLRWVPELQEMLFHPDLEVRQTARFAISHIQKKDTPPLVEYLIHIIDTQGSGRQRREAIRALGALGPQAAAAEDKLTAIAHDRNDSTRFMAAAALMGIWQESLDFGMGQQSQINKMLGAAPGETLDWEGYGRKIDNERQEILGAYSPSPGGGGGMF